MLRAPFAGVVAEVNAKLGEFLTPYTEEAAKTLRLFRIPLSPATRQIKTR